ncbi:PepSY-associated TM helix domain-containing protein [Herbaspirillum sp. RV1423]|uniref:PepSY-associated TM helix domain-containing protein n=1 Tax=Herbaspirillum sp. RV1423 TaxID=1443993 RepID=UPI0004BB6B96|nr:PepSY-associated TM helix domain-containing protein [Herbaspirillum sp. RV1423]
MSETTNIKKIADQQRRSFWLKQLHQWHWISSAACLIAMLLFAATGITLNHSAQIEAHPQVSNKQAQLPKDLLAQLTVGQHKDKETLPAPLRTWLDRQLSVSVGEQPGEWSGDELYVALPRPGGDAWLRVDLGNGKVEYEKTDRGWISYFNDLHKGRNAGAAWGWFIDIFAAACLVFCLTGLFLLHLHAGNRPMTWPLVGFGLVVPLVLAIVFIH